MITAAEQIDAMEEEVAEADRARPSRQADADPLPPLEDRGLMISWRRNIRI